LSVQAGRGEQRAVRGRCFVSRWIDSLTTATLGLVFVLVPAIGLAAEPSRPSERPLPDLEFEAPAESPSLLPPIPPLEDPRLAPTADPALELFVARWLFEGNTAYSDVELRAVVEPWTGRAIGPAELQSARDALTLHYVDAGYFTSGALIPDQDVSEGSIRVEIVEGSLEDIEIEGNERFRDFYLRERLELGGSTPLHVPTLERRIRLLQQDDRIGRIDASLRPGERIGEARLEVSVQEDDALHGSLETSNYIAPSLGDIRGRFEAGHSNVLGVGDELWMLVGGYEAGPEFEAGYRVPVTRYDATIGISGRWSESELVDRLGEELDVEGEFWNFEIDLRQPVYRTPELDLAVGLTTALRQSNTRILGEEINEVGPRTRVLVLRFYQELFWRGGNQVLAARSTTNFGLEGLGSTHSKRSDIPDSRFVSWLGQVQWLRRFDPWNVELLIRGDIQLSNDPLLGLEQYSAGGHYTVRGYRENQLVRDQGYSSAAELRLPIWRDRVDGRTLVQLAPFFDVGGGWNRNRPTLSPTTLYSTGLALRVAPWPFLRADVTWARRLADVERPDGLQGNGFQFQVVVDLF
jgi:hemolysin activation/secretion protein